jgi:hypothetical protein
MSITFSGQRAETLVMLKDKGPMTRNFAKLKELVRQIAGYPEVPDDRLHKAGRGLFREHVPADLVLDFLEGFEVSPRVLSANPANIAEYIRAQLAKDELTRWTIAIAAGKSGEKLQVPEAEELPLIQRIPISGQSRVQATECEVGVLVSPYRSQYAQDRYALARRRCYAVRDDFPRLAPSTLPLGISGVSYLLDLSTCGPYQVDEETIRQSLAQAVATAEG